MRLTKKNVVKILRFDMDSGTTNEEEVDIYHKLQALENIEEELGIDLITLFNILRSGTYIWIKNCKGINKQHFESLKHRGLDKNWYLTYSNNVRVKLKDYGEKWALTKKELEK